MQGTMMSGGILENQKMLAKHNSQSSGKPVCLSAFGQAISIKSALWVNGTGWTHINRRVHASLSHVHAIKRNISYNIFKFRRFTPVMKSGRV